jgi:spermidine synthase
MTAASDPEVSSQTPKESNPAMNQQSETTSPPEEPANPPLQEKGKLFLISVLLLFLELACIRWLPAHVAFLTFFTNTVLLACFLGMSVGCLAAGHRRNYLAATPSLLLLTLAGVCAVLYLRHRLSVEVDVGSQQTSPQLVFFGTEYEQTDLAHFVVPIEAVAGAFFLLVALVFVGPGQALGQALTRVPNRLLAYTINILGSLAGILLFALVSWCELAPFWWFLPVVLVLAYLLLPRPFAGQARWRWVGSCGLLIACLLLASLSSGLHPSESLPADQYAWEAFRSYFTPGSAVLDKTDRSETFWSPYYRVDYSHPPSRRVDVNLIGHQEMTSRQSVAPAYSLPHLLNRDSGRPPFADVLIIGAGSGNDVSRALQWGARHVDAVEIDPVIQRLGRDDHPDHPYQDPRVTVHLDDGRNFLHSTDRQYDLIVYALVDSLILHSSYSNIRLESFLFTRQAFADVRRRLKPDGLFVMSNYFRQGWIVARLKHGLEEVFDDNNPLVLALPYVPTIEPEQQTTGFTVMLAGNTGPLRDSFRQQSDYWLPRNKAVDPATPNGFRHAPRPEESEHWEHYGLAEVLPAVESLRTATDAWPFLYLRRPMIPALSLRGAAVMAGLALLLIFLFLPRSTAQGRHWRFEGPLFFLGAGFMLIETKAVVHMALLFGSTWMVNSVVFFAVLVMILLANAFVLKFRPVRLWPYYAGLLVALGVQCIVPLDFFLGMPRGWQVLGSCLLVFTPILLAGVLFAVLFERTRQPELGFGANIAGAMLGGLAEYASMLVGFQYLALLAILFYALSLVRRPTAG